MKIHRSDLAESDLLEIWVHIALGNPGAADRFIDRIHRKLKLLAKSPGIGQPRDQLSPGLRSFPIGDYLIFYKKIADGIVIVRILSGYRDIDAVFAPSSL